MDWLLVSLEKNESCFDGVKKIISSHDGFISEYSSGSFDNNFYKNVKECDYCVWLCSSEQSLCSGDFAYAAGYLIGKGIPFFCVCDTSKNDIQLVSSDCHFFSKIEQLEKTLSDKFPEILEIEKQKKARQALLEAGIPFNPDSFAFHIAADNESECNLFIDAGISVNSCDASGTPMLCVAARHNRMTMIEKLLDFGADINSVSKDRGYTPVMDAVWKSNTEIVEYLVKKGSDLSSISRDGQPILVLAVGTGNEKICRILVENGADPFVADSMGMSALAYAKLFKKNSLIPLFEAKQK